MSNKYQTKMFNPQLHKKQFSVSDYVKAERNWWERAAIIAGLAVILVGYFIVSGWDFQNRADSLGVEPVITGTK